MTNRVLDSMMTVAAVLAVVWLTAGDAAAQYAPDPPARQPRVRALPTAPWNPPRTPDGQPDMQGVWQPDAPSASHSLEEGAEPENSRGRGRTPEQIAEDAATRPQLILNPAPGNRLPYQPWAAAKQREHLANILTPIKAVHIEPEDRCALMGVPRSSYRFDFQIAQPPGYVVILYEWTHAYRIIPLDGRPHLADGIKLFNGDSRGRWEGNTLVIDVTNLNDQTWFDAHGTFHSDALHVTERWTFLDADTIHFEATVEDPNVFTRPWKVAFPIDRHKEKGYELIEEACYEGNGRTIDEMVATGRYLKAQGVTGIHEHTPGFYSEK